MADSQPGWFARNTPKLSAWGLGLAAGGTLVALVSGPLYQLGVVPLFPSFGVLAMGVLGALIGGLVCLVSLAVSIGRHKGEAFTRNATALVGVVVGLIVFAIPASMLTGGYPSIHEVSTDLDNPPVFVDILPLRQGAPNPPEYVAVLKSPQSGQDLNVPELQKQAFPDLVPVKLDVPPAQAFDQALAAVNAMKWTLVAAKPDDGRIEAYDKTAWFGFIDDVVIRVTSDGTGSRIDVRSKSRLGFGDVGKNGKRVRAYIAKLTGKKGHG
ncbi:MAG: DUF1499 domain-containing protein [Rhodospirillaceae bacterium]|nr:DUF1499 domain-containing protein [Rhodospirillaceae bacterium]